MVDRILWLRGIGEPLSRNMLTPLAHVDGVEAVEVPWPAQYGPVPSLHGMDYADARQRGRKMLHAKLSEKPAIVLGYSGGAHVVHEVAAAGHPNMRGVLLMADPIMPDLGNHRWGIAGKGARLNIPAHWVANPRDIICQTPADSPLRLLADFTDTFSADNFPAWTNDVARRIASHRLQTTLLSTLSLGGPVQAWARWREALTGATGYLDGQEHIRAYHQRQYLGPAISWLAEQLN